MEKLELKHLAAYLPYNLKVTFEHDEEHTHDLVGLNYNWQGVDLISQFGDFGRSEIEKAKPILRPLSDLANEIEHKGEKFMPADKLPHLYLSYLIDDPELIMTIEYEDVQKLISWHFDVFNLIEKGLAVPLT